MANIRLETDVKQPRIRVSFTRLKQAFTGTNDQPMRNPQTGADCRGTMVLR